MLPSLGVDLSFSPVEASPSTVSPGSCAHAGPAEACKRRGSRFYRQQQFEAAAEEYTCALELAPGDFKLLCYRAACYASVEAWTKCYEDASLLTRIRPEYVKAWSLCVKALWHDGLPVLAKSVLADGLRANPDSPKLLELNTDIDRCCVAGYQDGKLVRSSPSASRGSPGASRGREDPRKLFGGEETRKPLTACCTPSTTSSGSPSPGPSAPTPSSRSDHRSRRSRVVAISPLSPPELRATPRSADRFGMMTLL